MEFVVATVIGLSTRGTAHSDIWYFAPVRSGNGAKLSSAGLWLNASKSESVLEAMMFGPANVDGVKIELMLVHQIRWARPFCGRRRGFVHESKMKYPWG